MIEPPAGFAGLLVSALEGSEASVTDDFGLSVMRQRARSLEGSLVVESKGGRSTTVRVRLPLRDDEDGGR